jgi:hypothetical protein
MFQAEVAENMEHALSAVNFQNPSRVTKTLVGPLTTQSEGEFESRCTDMKGRTAN